MQSLQKKVVNIVIIGDQGAGKTTLFKQVTTGQFTPEYYSTIGVDVGIKEISIEGFQYHLQFWDTSGQERFQAIIQSYYRRAECCVIVYDLIDPEDYKNVKHWMKQFSFRCDLDPEQKFPFVIVGTHLDKLTEVQKQNLDPSDNIQSFRFHQRMIIQYNKQYKPLLIVQYQNNTTKLNIKKKLNPIQYVKSLPIKSITTQKNQMIL